MNFAEQPPSAQWAILQYRGEKLAEVWFKPEGEPHGLTFRIPHASFQIPGMDQQLTAANLLRSVGIAAEEIELWRIGDDIHAAIDGTNPELKSPFPPPLQEASELEIHVRMRLPAEAAAATQGAEMEPPADTDAASAGGALDEKVTPRWEDLAARWKAILGLEATIDTLRISMESLQSEMEGALRKTLTPEEKIHARRADIANWTKAKSRVHHAVPRVREFIHRAVWSLGAPERKQLEEIYKNHIEPQIPLPHMDKLMGQLENLQKDRQVFSSHGTTVYNECKNISSSVQEALRTLQSNADANARNKKNAAGGGKFFKQLRRWSGAG